MSADSAEDVLQLARSIGLKGFCSEQPREVAVRFSPAAVGPAQPVSKSQRAEQQFDPDSAADVLHLARSVGLKGFGSSSQSREPSLGDANGLADFHRGSSGSNTPPRQLDSCSADDVLHLARSIGLKGYGSGACVRSHDAGAAVDATGNEHSYSAPQVHPESPPAVVQAAIGSVTKTSQRMSRLDYLCFRAPAAKNAFADLEAAIGMPLAGLSPRQPDVEFQSEDGYRVRAFAMPSSGRLAAVRIAGRLPGDVEAYVGPVPKGALTTEPPQFSMAIEFKLLELAGR